MREPKRPTRAAGWGRTESRSRAGRPIHPIDSNCSRPTNTNGLRRTQGSPNGCDGYEEAGAADARSRARWYAGRSESLVR